MDQSYNMNNAPIPDGYRDPRLVDPRHLPNLTLALAVTLRDLIESQYCNSEGRGLSVRGYTLLAPLDDALKPYRNG